MFGDDVTNQAQDSAMQPMDPSVMADPNTGQPAVDHQITPAYPADDQAVASADGQMSVQAMHQDAVAASSTTAPTQDATSLASAPADDDLLAIKQDALSALSPLVGSLDQSAEEKFRTTMMLIQASDDKTLVRAAYEAAQAITDEKVKAQALLDVVNEINYFTSHTS